MKATISFLASSFILLLSLMPFSAFAGDLNQDSTAEFGDYTVHYSAFNSTFLLPDIAAAYGLVRAKNQILLNITVQDKTGKSIDAKLNGYAQNLMQQKKALTFKTIKEPHAVYSIGALRITNEEVFNFVIEITPVGAEPFTLKFTRKLYVE